MASLKKKEYSPIYFLYGEESYFIDQIADYIEDHVLTEGEKGFNQSVYYGKDIDAKTLLAAARRFPMMSPYQVIIVKEAQNLGKVDELLPYIENPLDSTILVFCYKNKSPDKRTKFGKAILEHVAFESKRLYDNQVAPWVESYLREKGKRMSPKALHWVAEALGTEISRVANELDKLLLNTGPEAEISDQQVSASIGINREYNVFELQSALAVGDFNKCIRIIQYFASSKNQFGKPVVLIGSLYSWFSKLLLVHASPSKDERSLASVLGVNPFFVKEYLHAARHYSPQKLEKIMALMLEYDLKSKGVNSGSEDDGALLKELMVKIYEA